MDVGDFRLEFSAIQLQPVVECFPASCTALSNSHTFPVPALPAPWPAGLALKRDRCTDADWEVSGQPPPLMRSGVDWPSAIPGTVPVGSPPPQHNWLVWAKSARADFFFAPVHPWMRSCFFDPVAVAYCYSIDFNSPPTCLFHPDELQTHLAAWRSLRLALELHLEKVLVSFCFPLISQI